MYDTMTEREFNELVTYMLPVPELGQPVLRQKKVLCFSRRV